MRQHEAVIQTMEKMGGVATLGKLYAEVLKVPGCEWKTKTPFASIRRIVQMRKEIYKIKPGLYGLVSMRPGIESLGILQETPGNVASKLVAESSHAYYQGLLLVVGRLRDYATFAPNQDRKRPFLTETIGDTRTLNEIPPFSYPQLVRRCQTVDVTWFNERRMPAGFFEIEFSTDMQNSLVKLADLQDFYARMVIVSDRARRREFESRMTSASFKDIRGRVKMLHFDSLVKQYESLMEAGAADVTL